MTYMLKRRKKNTHKLLLTGTLCAFTFTWFVYWNNSEVFVFQNVMPCSSFVCPRTRTQPDTEKNSRTSSLSLQHIYIYILFFFYVFDFVSLVIDRLNICMRNLWFQCNECKNLQFSRFYFFYLLFLLVW